MQFKFEGDKNDQAEVQRQWLVHVPDAVAAGDLKSSAMNRALQVADKMGDGKISSALKSMAFNLLSVQQLSQNKEGGWEFAPNTFKNRDDLGAAVVVALEKGMTKALDVAAANIRKAFGSDEGMMTALKSLEDAVKSRVPAPREPAPRGKHKIRFG